MYHVRSKCEGNGCLLFDDLPVFLPTSVVKLSPEDSDGWAGGYLPYGGEGVGGGGGGGGEFDRVTDISQPSANLNLFPLSQRVEC